MTGIEDDIRAALAHRASTTTATPVAASADFVSLRPDRPQQSKGRSARYVGAAAALAVLVVGLVAVNRSDGDVSPSDSVTPAQATTSPIDSPQSPSTLPGATVDGQFPYTGLDYATTDTWLPQWPQVNASEPAATTSGYGMNLCDDGYGTKVTRVDPADGPAHTYAGTLCVFIDLAQPRVQATTSCATSTPDTVDARTYARCQRRTVLTDTSGAGTAVRATASDTAQAQMAAFPGPTRSNQAEPFGTRVTNASAGTIVDLGTVSVTLSTKSDQVCVAIVLPGAEANGCVGKILLSTGLAYGAFQDGDGPIELVGIVPDDITSVEVDGQVVTPTSNVWHHTASSGKPLTITVRSSNGTTASTS